MKDQAFHPKLLKTRGYADFFEFYDKNIKERGIAEEFMEALCKSLCLEITDVKQHPNGENKAPDIEFTFGAEKWGVELTELVDQTAIEQVQKGTLSVANWSEAHLAECIKRRIDAKGKVNWGGDDAYDCYVLLLHTDEPQITEQRLEDVLQQCTFGTKLIDRAFVLMSYDPTKSEYPLLSINIKKDSELLEE